MRVSHPTRSLTGDPRQNPSTRRTPPPTARLDPDGFDSITSRFQQFTIRSLGDFRLDRFMNNSTPPARPPARNSDRRITRFPERSDRARVSLIGPLSRRGRIASCAAARPHRESPRSARCSRLELFQSRPRNGDLLMPRSDRSPRVRRGN